MEKAPVLNPPVRLVVDANILLAGLLRASTTRSLLLDPRLDLFAPEHLLAESEKHTRRSAVLRKRLGLSQAEIASLFSVLTSRITVIPQEGYALALAEGTLLAPHPEDAPYLALALTLDIPLWSNDAGMRGQHAVRVVATTELIRSIA